MNKFNVDIIIEKIKNKELFEAETEDSSFFIKINKWVSFIGAAIHNGSNLTSEFEKKILLNNSERRYEEDFITGDFIAEMPIIIIAKDSRYEYDLNRDIENSIYREAWGEKVWKEELTKKQKEKSYIKHENFYKVIETLIETIETNFGFCYIYDIHSYNYKRRIDFCPVFNIGTSCVNKIKFEQQIKNWEKELKNISIPFIKNTLKLNAPFNGSGYFPKHISLKFNNTLVFSTEIKKIYCKEKTGIIYPNIFNNLRKLFQLAVKNNNEYIT